MRDFSFTAGARSRAVQRLDRRARHAGRLSRPAGPAFDAYGVGSLLHHAGGEAQLERVRKQAVGHDEGGAFDLCALPARHKERIPPRRRLACRQCEVGAVRSVDELSSARQRIRKAPLDGGR